MLLKDKIKNNGTSKNGWQFANMRIILQKMIQSSFFGKFFFKISMWRIKKPFSNSLPDPSKFQSEVWNMWNSKSSDQEISSSYHRYPPVLTFFSYQTTKTNRYSIQNCGKQFMVQKDLILFNSLIDIFFLLQ